MSGRPPPPKPWERNRAGGAAAGASCCAPGSGGADGLPKPWERPQGAAETVTPVTSAGTASAVGAPASNSAVVPAASRPNAARPWERPGGPTSGTAAASTSYGSAYTNPYSSGLGGGYGGIYNSPYNRPYGSTYGAGMYGGGMYSGGGMYGGGYGGGMYGSSMYGGGMYGSGMYGGGMYGRPMGMLPGPFDPNDPNGPPQPPSAWQAMLHSVQGIMHFFGRLSFLVDENAHAVHFFVTALLQLLDRFGSLYGELARFILRLLGFKTDRRKGGKAAADGGAAGPPGQQLPQPTAGAPQLAVPPAGSDNWNSLWSPEGR